MRSRVYVKGIVLSDIKLLISFDQEISIHVEFSFHD